MSDYRSEAHAVTAEWVTRVWNEGDASAIDALFHPEGLAHGMGPEPMVGPDAFKPFHAALHAACDDVRCTLGQVVTEGDRLAALLHYDLCHSKSEGRVKFDVMAMVRVEGGQIVEAWNVIDWLTPFVQSGIVPANALEVFLTPA